MIKQEEKLGIKEKNGIREYFLKKYNIIWFDEQNHVSVKSSGIASNDGIDKQDFLDYFDSHPVQTPFCNSCWNCSCQ